MAGGAAGGAAAAGTAAALAQPGLVPGRPGAGAGNPLRPNGKGGANKPTTVMLAAVFARNGGGPVLAWDNNEARGTLGWRTEQGPHNATVMDLLPNTANLVAPSAQSALLARFVHLQTEDKFDVLRSKPDVLASEQKIMGDFDALQEVAS